MYYLAFHTFIYVGFFQAAILHTNNFLIGAGAVLGERWIIATAFQMGA